MKLVDTWFCTECAKNGRPFVYVDKREKLCPFGHSRKSAALPKAVRKDHHHG